MNKQIIEAIEEALKSGITQRKGVKNVASKIGEAKPMADSAFGFNSRASQLLNKAEMSIQRAHNEPELATRKMAGAVAYIDEHAEIEDEAQGDIFDDEPPAAAIEPMQLNGEVSPTIEAHRLKRGGDAFLSISLPQLMAATGDELPELRGYFEVDDKLFVAIGLSEDRWLEAHEILFLDEIDEDELEFETKGGHVGQHALLDCEGDGVLDEVILGERVRFVVPQQADELELPDDEPEEVEEAV